jgi:catechol 2,3-dioxygenase-like lactoylglutathione lyase family enzyme
MATVRYLVSDVELAIEFYTRHLGFALRRGCPGASAPCAECGEADLHAAGPPVSA